MTVLYFLNSDENINAAVFQAAGKILVLDPSKRNIDLAEGQKSVLGSKWELVVPSRALDDNYREDYGNAVADFFDQIGIKEERWFFATASKIQSDQYRPLRAGFVLEIERQIGMMSPHQDLIVIAADDSIIKVFKTRFLTSEIAVQQLGKANQFGEVNPLPGKLQRLFAVFKSILQLSVFGFLNLVSPPHFENTLNRSGPNLVVQTIFRDFPSSAEAYQDYYFGALHLFLTRKNIFFWGSPYQWTFKNRVKYMRSRRDKKSIFITDDFLTTFGVVANTVKKWFVISWKTRSLLRRNKITASKAALQSIIGEFIREELFSMPFFSEISKHSISVHLRKFFPDANLLLPYEGRALEKQSILAFRSNNDQTKILGYHHAPIDARHTGLYIPGKELCITPLPDIIFTCGSFGKNELIERGFPGSRLKILGALKQLSFLEEKTDSPSSVSERPRILVLLGAEMIQTRFLLYAMREATRSGIDLNKYSWRFRFHPAYRDLQHFRNSVSVEIPYEISTNRNLLDDLKWSNFVINNGTAAAVEAMAKGKPIFYVACKFGLPDNALYGATAGVHVASDFMQFCQFVDSSGYVKSSTQDPDKIQSFLDEMYKKASPHDFAKCIEAELLG